MFFSPEHSDTAWSYWNVTFSNSLSPPPSVLSSSLGEMASVRAELLSYFTHVLLGDALSAEYLILHLISTVYVSEANSPHFGL